LAVYVLAVVAFAVMLYLSFRTLGIATVTPEQGGPLLERLCTSVAAGIEEIAIGLTSRVGEGNDSVDMAREGRKRLAMYEQQMARLDGDGCDNSLLERRDSLASAVDTLAWACRMAESPHYGDSSALQRAVRALSADALTLMGQAVARK
jgi:hypothetical protein